jgi:RHS repeat-associated protein
MVAQVDWGAGTPTRRFAAVDHLGSTRYLVGLDDALGVVSEEALEFYPFGQFKFDGTPPDPDTTHLFTGHERDLGLHLSELDYMHARYYSPNLGRFMSVDPVGGTIGSSQSWNRYTYALDNPARMIDPTGKGNVDMIAHTQLSRVNMSGHQKEIQQKYDAVALGFLVSTGGSLATMGVGGLPAGVLLGGSWNWAGGVMTRYLDGDGSTAAFDRGAMVGDGALGMLGSWGGNKLGRLAGVGGARLVSFGFSTVIPPMVDIAIDQAVSALESSGLLDQMVEIAGSIPSPFVPANPSARDPSVNCHLPVQQENLITKPVSQMSMVEYLAVASH